MNIRSVPKKSMIRSKVSTLGMKPFRLFRKERSSIQIDLTTWEKYMKAKQIVKQFSDT